MSRWFPEDEWSQKTLLYLWIHDLEVAGINYVIWSLFSSIYSIISNPANALCPWAFHWWRTYKLRLSARLLQCVILWLETGFAEEYLLSVLRPE
jgi:hypothetical protein